MSTLTANASIYKDGEIVFAEYERGDKFYLIQSGNIELIKTFGAVSKTLDILKPAEMFGEMALLEDSPRSATAIALGETKLMEFDRGNFQNLVLTNPQIAFKLLKLFVRRIYDAKRRFMILALDEPNARVADVFLMLDEDSSTSNAQQSNRREFNVTIENVARWSCLAPTQAKDAISSFIKCGYLEVRQNSMIVKDINNFVRLVNAARNKLSGR
ncbi:MAG: Crp/Fnr family transcriptional regulator [Spirochaetaceae bacterium]|jgi:CRP-like cAMP-binding protein|nr:Crp/Fnr family transcriptional regulator [Spirochaetaceae bacterium]